MLLQTLLFAEDACNKDVHISGDILRALLISPDIWPSLLQTLLFAEDACNKDGHISGDILRALLPK